jgi:hypothetical protein
MRSTAIYLALLALLASTTFAQEDHLFEEFEDADDLIESVIAKQFRNNLASVLASQASVPNVYAAKPSYSASAYAVPSSVPEAFAAANPGYAKAPSPSSLPQANIYAAAPPSLAQVNIYAAAPPPQQRSESAAQQGVPEAFAASQENAYSAPLRAAVPSSAPQYTAAPPSAQGNAYVAAPLSAQGNGYTAAGAPPAVLQENNYAAVPQQGNSYAAQQGNVNAVQPATQQADAAQYQQGNIYATQPGIQQVDANAAAAAQHQQSNVYAAKPIDTNAAVASQQQEANLYAARPAVPQAIPQSIPQTDAYTAAVA